MTKEEEINGSKVSKPRYRQRVSKEELIFRIKGTGCKMLDKIDLNRMNIDQMCDHLEASCCPALKEIIKQAEKSI